MYPMIIALITAIVVDVIQLTGYKCKYFFQVLLVNIIFNVYVLLYKQISLLQYFERHQRLNCNVVKLLISLFCCCQFSDNILNPNSWLMNLQNEKRKNKENYSNCITVHIFIQTNLQTLATFSKTWLLLLKWRILKQLN